MRVKYEGMNVIPNANGCWDKYTVNVACQKDQMEKPGCRSCPFVIAEDCQDMDADAMWRIINDADLNNYLMSTEIDKLTGPGGGPCGEAFRDDGLVEGHAYSLISAISVDKFRLVQL